MKKKHSKSFGLFPSYEYWTPDVKGILLLILWLAVGMGLGVAVTFLMSLSTGKSFTEDYGILISYPLQFIPAMLYASFKSHRNEGFDNVANPLDDSRFAPMGASLVAVLCVFGTIAAAFLVEPVSLLLPDMPAFLEEALKKLAEGPLWVSILSTAVFAPFFEEWLCRGMVLRGLLSKTKPSVAILVSALFFALIHGNPWQAIPAFLLGSFFGIVYWKTGSLKLTMLMHSANNLASIAAMQIPALKEYDYLYCAFEGRMGQYFFLYGLCAILVIVIIHKLLSKEFRRA